MAVAAATLGGGCAEQGTGSSGSRGSGRRLDAGGSTFVYPMMSKWADDYRKAKGVELNYQPIGSGGGISQMTAKTLDFGCTDSPLNEEQLQKCKDIGGGVVHIPLAMGGVVPIYNLPEVKDAPLRFTGPVLADIYLGKITKWNDKALKDLNPDAALPDKEIAVVHRSEGSGTTYIFSDYLCQVSPEGWKTKVGKGTALNWPAGVGQKGSDGVSGQVKRVDGSIGYVELIYALQNKMTYGTVKNKAGNYVAATLESVTEAARNKLKDIPEDLRFSIVDADGKESYPISGTVWAVLYQKQPAGKGPMVVDYLRWVTHDGQKDAEKLDYARLPKELVERVEKKLDSIKADG
jgi:phosphate transport system substrate-binding protein